MGEYLVPNDASLLKKAGIPATLNIANPTGEVVMFKVRACVRACVRVCVCACVGVSVGVSVGDYALYSA